MSAVVEHKVEVLHGIPLVAGADVRTVIFGGRDGVVTRARFQRQVHALAALLPEASHAINLCEDLHRFLLEFCAAAVPTRWQRWASPRAAAANRPST